MTTQDVVHLESGDFKWQQVPDLGKCLVPVGLRVTPSDVSKGRTYVNDRSERQRFISVDGNRRVLDVDKGFTWQGLSLQHTTAAALAAYINKESRASSVFFEKWAD